MGVYEVTQGQYKAIGCANRSSFKGDNLPVENVPWSHAVEFCRRLSQKEGKTYRLPTEAEWEYACRAGTTTPFNTGETISTDQANYDGNYVYGNGNKGVCRKKTTEVGNFRPNAFGLYDMHGNVWEWCQDWYDERYYTRIPLKSPAVDPVGQPTRKQRVLRGGSWDNNPWFCRSAYRPGNSPMTSFVYCGFRVVMEIEQVISDSRTKVKKPKTIATGNSKEPMAQIKGKFMDEDTGRPISIRPRLFFIHPNDITLEERKEREVAIQAQKIKKEADSSGAFSIVIVNVVPGECLLFTKMYGILTPAFAVSPGEVVDLGTIKVKTK